MVSIFEDGFLLNEFMNVNYRGLVGWPCQSKKPSVYARRFLDDTLFAVVEGFKITRNWKNSLCMRIPQFTPEDIPEGELVWYRLDDDEDWWLRPVTKADIGSIKSYYPAGVVPYLIAETAERAEELKDWYKC